MACSVWIMTFWRVVLACSADALTCTFQGWNAPPGGIHDHDQGKQIRAEPLRGAGQATGPDLRDEQWLLRDLGCTECIRVSISCYRADARLVTKSRHAGGGLPDRLPGAHSRQGIRCRQEGRSQRPLS